MGPQVMRRSASGEKGKQGVYKSLDDLLKEDGRGEGAGDGGDPEAGCCGGANGEKHNAGR